jgi:hypothetical protein
MKEREKPMVPPNRHEGPSEQAMYRQALWRLAAYVAMTFLVSGVLLLLNVGIVYTVFAGLAQYTLDETYAQKIGQFVLFIGPFLLLFPEWYIYDVLIAPSRQRS